MYHALMPMQRVTWSHNQKPDLALGATRVLLHLMSTGSLIYRLPLTQLSSQLAPLHTITEPSPAVKVTLSPGNQHLHLSNTQLM